MRRCIANLPQQFRNLQSVIIRSSVALSIGLALIAPASSAYGAEFFEGVWAETAEECLDKEGPNSRTSIDLSNKIEGKLVPLLDQYENHCRVKKVIPGNKAAKLQVQCFEFWENFENNTDGGDAEIVISQESAEKIKIDGKVFVKCKD